MFKLLAGASGYSYAEWKGNFYPAEIKADQMLAWYAERLPTVEINNSFYRMPKTSVLEAWAAATPAAFRFSIKASRRITHDARLKVEGAAEPLAYLYRNLAALRDKRGAVLFQLPPNLKKDLPRLNAFLQLLPADHRAAFEFRNDTWFDDEVYDALKAAQAALVLSEREDSTPPPWVETAPWGYVRLRLEHYSDDDLARWATRLAATSWNEACVYLMHEPTAPAYAQTLMRLAAGWPSGQGASPGEAAGAASPHISGSLRRAPTIPNETRPANETTAFGPLANFKVCFARTSAWAWVWAWAFGIPVAPPFVHHFSAVGRFLQATAQPADRPGRWRGLELLHGDQFIQEETMKKTLIALSLAVAGAVALAQPVPLITDGGPPLPTVRISSGVEYLNGGSDIDTANYLKSRGDEYPLQVIFSGRGGAYGVASSFTLRGRDGLVVTVPNAGPYLLMKVPPGTYAAEAEFKGAVEKRTVSVGAGVTKVSWNTSRASD